MKQILVTGGTGLIGSHLTALLKDSEFDIRVGSRYPRADNATRFEWADTDSWHIALESAARVFVLIPESRQAASNAQRFLSIAQEYDVEHITLLSAMGSQHDRDLMGMTTLETIVRCSFESWNVLYANTFMQNFMRGAFYNQIMTQSSLTLPVGDTAVSFIDARDIAAVAAETLTTAEYQNQTFTLTGPESLSFAEAISIIADEVNRDFTFNPIQPEAMREILLQTGLPVPQIDMLLMFSASLREGFHRDITEHVEQITGRVATPFRMFVRQHRSAWAAKEMVE